MSQDRRHGVNIVDARGNSLLLTTTGGGDAVHLTREEEPTRPGRAAVHDFYFDASKEYYRQTVDNYDRADLLDPRWAPTTLCGREWAVMIGGDGGPLHDHDSVAFAPTCRRCLTLMDGFFPALVVDGRVPLVAQVVVDTLVEHGYTEVHRVPGDQQAALRAAVRAQVRKRTGHQSRTLVRGSTIFVTCDALYAEHEEEHMRMVVEAIDDALGPDGLRPQQRVRGWVVSWDAWDVG